MKLDIYRCEFELPRDFEGTLGDALMLLAKYRLEKEKEYKIINNGITSDFSEEHFKELADKNKLVLPEGKCNISYRIWEE